MKVIAEITYGSILFFLCVLLIGMGMGGGAVLVVTQLRSGTVELSCGADTFILPKANMTTDLQDSCKKAADLLDEEQTQAREFAAASSFVNCSVVRPGQSGVAGNVFLGMQRVSLAQTATYNAVCDKYKAQINQLLQAKLQGNADAGAIPVNQRQEEQTIAAQFRVEVQGLTADNSKQQEMREKVKKAQREMRRKVLSADGGYKIMPDRENDTISNFRSGTLLGAVLGNYLHR